MTITNAFLVTNFKVMVPIKIKIGPEYFVVTTVSTQPLHSVLTTKTHRDSFVLQLREQEIFWSLNAILNNVFGMIDIVDVYLPPVPPTQKTSSEGEIHITHDSGKATMVIVVPNREEVYKVNEQKKIKSNV